MSDIPEAFGTASEGGLFARAISNNNGAGGKIDTSGHFSENACLNCGTTLVGSHCHACGQKAHLHRTLSAIGHDLMHGVLHLDGKLWRTLPLLALNPGKLTRRYVDGERAYFVSPMAMFLFTVFLMFAVFQAIGFTAPTDIPDPISGARSQAIEARSDLQTRYDSLDNEDAAERAELEQDIASLDAAVEAIDSGEAFSFENAEGLDVSLSPSGTGIDFIDHGLVKKWQKNPGLMLYKLQANSYKFSWLLIPLSLPFVWLLFAWRREFKAYDHAVFVTYSLAFMSLMFIALSLLGKLGIGAGWLFTIFATLAPVHMFRHLKQTYGLSKFGTTWRLIVLIIAIVIVLTLFLQVLLLLGAF
tara:strand:+ start:1048 stop:2121 length:1074 start_codon:yes stop_codon:yes gene_type:complete